MGKFKRPEGFSDLGNHDQAVSPHLKAWIWQENVSVCAVYGEEISRDFQVNWNSPFEQDSIGGYFEKMAGLAQLGTGVTSKSQLNSAQVWEGNRPTVFTMPLVFYALSDARKEVMEPIRALERMLVPATDDYSPFGGTPKSVAIQIGYMAYYPNCVITGLTVPMGRPKTADGYMVWADVNLQVETKEMINLATIDATHTW